MSNRVMAISPQFGKGAAEQRAQRKGGRSAAAQFALITILAGGTAFMSFAVAAQWMPPVIAHISAALVRGIA